MFERLLSLLLHVKGGAVATVLVLGASGALVTATVQNGTTTITITQPGEGAAETAVAPVTVTTVANTTSTTDTKVDPAILALFTRTKAEDDPTSPATGGNGCSDAAKAINEQVRRVNDAFKTDEHAVAKLRKDARTDAAKKAVSDALKNIKDIRQAAIKAIHATNPSATCKKDDDEDLDEHQGDNHDANDEKDNKDENDKDGDHEDEHDGTTPPAGAAPTTVAPTTPSVVFSGDAKAIADAAIAAMNLWVTDAQKAIAAQPAATTSTTKKSDNKSHKDNHDNKGKGGDKGQHENDD